FGALAGTLAATKYTWAVAGICWLALMAAAWWLGRERAAAWRLVAAWGVTLVAVWVGCGQPWWGPPVYLVRTFDLAAGYSAAMSGYGDRREVLYSIVVLAAALGWLAVAAWHDRRRAPTWAVAAGCAVTLGLAWKAGIVRHGDAPRLTLLLVLPLAVLWPLAMPRLRELRGHRVAAITLCLAGLGGMFWFGATAGRPRIRGWRTWWNRVCTNAEIIFRPAAQLQQLRALRGRTLQRERLPFTSRVVQRLPIDVLSVQAGAVLANDLNWTPRPVFQSYAAYTAALSKRNAAHFLARTAPPYVLLNPIAIDGHYPGLDDGEALRAILTYYTPVLQEQSYLLLQRHIEGAAPPPIARDRLEWRRTRFRAWVPCPPPGRGLTVAFLRVGNSALGGLRAAVYKPPPVELETELADGSTQRHVLIPAMAERGFVLGGALRSGRDLAQWFRGHRTPAVRRLRVLYPHHRGRYFRRSIEVAFGHLQPPARPLRIPRRFHPAVFSPAPAEIRASIQNPIRVENAPAILLHPPATAHFPLAPGRYAVRLQCGLLPGALARSDGAGVELRLRDGAGDRLLLRRSLLPSREDDRGPQHLTARVQVGQNGELVLHTTPGRAGDARNDWLWIREFLILPDDGR
ncbi:MAG: hypothetical protein ACYTGX_16975, partial [Planctomycetota bacterium]